MKKIQDLSNSKSLDVTKYVSPAEAAERLGLTYQTIRTYLWDGRLTTFKLRRNTLVSVDELDSMPRTIGRPPEEKRQ